MKEKKCPICEIELPDPLPLFCSQCGWDLKNDLTLNIFLDMPDSVIEEYKQRFAIARRNWNEKAEAVREKAELEKRLKQLEAAMKNRKTEPAPEKPPKPESKPAPEKITNHDYSEKTPVPALKRDPFETIDEFEKRINQYPPVPAGTAELIKENYNITTGRFLLNVSWADWTKNLEGFQQLSDFYITAERDKARAIFEAGSKHCLFGGLKADKEYISVDAIELFALNHVIPVVFSLKKLWTDPVTGMEFVYVPSGTFMMGDIFGDGSDDKKPVHEVRLSSFYMGKYQLTQGQWKKVMGNNPSDFKKGDEYPVETVSWNDAQEFINKLSKLNNGKYRFSLPTEAQWEYACRSGGKKEKYSGGDNIDDAAWYDGNSGSSTHPVGQKKANGLSIYDMSGNVWEWCQDWYGKYTADAVVDPVGPSGGVYRVLRGGSWDNYAQNCRSAMRDDDGPGSRHDNAGFRLLRSCP